ncbi:MAG: hypothetical protein M3N43_13390 [Actinomycetota bacterium]|nr:hypothetical protein [Actinomycetota bacterium]
MADLVDDLLIEAGMALLRADTGLTIYPDLDGVTPDTAAPPYVRVYPYIERPPDAGGNNLNGTSGTWTVRWICHCVAANERAATAVAMRVRVALLDARPTVAGRECGLIRHDGSAPPRRDSDLGYQVFDLIEMYRLTSTPA